MIAAAAFIACSTSALDSVRIVGGSTAQRELVQETVSAFDVATGRAVDLRVIRFERSVGSQNGFDVAGRYTNERVLLLDTLVGEELERVVNHELCHALDDDLSLSDSRQAELDELREVVLDDVADARSGGRERREVLARLCERGGPAASLLTVSSDDLPEAARAVFLDLRDAFAGSALQDASPDWGGTVESAVHHDASQFRVALLVTHELKLSWDEEEAWVDPWTGLEVERSDLSAVQRTTTETPWGEDLPLRIHYNGETPVGASVVFVGLGHEYLVRYVLPDGDGWAVRAEPVGPLGHTQAWAAEGWFWVATHTEGSTTWTPVRP